MPRPSHVDPPRWNGDRWRSLPWQAKRRIPLKISITYVLRVTNNKPRCSVADFVGRRTFTRVHWVNNAGSDFRISWKPDICAFSWHQPRYSRELDGVQDIFCSLGNISTNPTRAENRSLPKSSELKGIRPTSNTTSGHLEGGCGLRRRG